MTSKPAYSGKWSAATELHDAVEAAIRGETKILEDLEETAALEGDDGVLQALSDIDTHIQLLDSIFEQIHGDKSCTLYDMLLPLLQHFVDWDSMALRLDLLGAVERGQREAADLQITDSWVRNA